MRAAPAPSPSPRGAMSQRPTCASAATTTPRSIRRAMPTRPAWISATRLPSRFGVAAERPSHRATAIASAWGLHERGAYRLTSLPSVGFLPSGKLHADACCRTLVLESLLDLLLRALGQRVLTRNALSARGDVQQRIRQFRLRDG